VTEQNGDNPEVMQESPPSNVGGELDHAPAEHESHEPEHEVSAVEHAVESAVPDNVAPEEAAPQEAAPVEVATADSEHDDDDDGAESIVAVPVKPKPVKSEGPRSRKAAAAEAPVATDVPKSESMNWYILKVQSNREESIREGLLRRVAIQGLDRFFGEVIVPTEKVTEFKGGKKRVIKRKLYPGYLVVHMEINEDTWFLVRETPGIGDFTGASGIPTPMLPHEVERIVMKQEEKSEKAPDLKIPFTKGDRVKVIEGNFENFEGEVENIDKTNGRVTVMITIFNRTTPVEFEYWQVESL
jgi:transcriptional antiterminator NusG